MAEELSGWLDRALSVLKNPPTDIERGMQRELSDEQLRSLTEVIERRAESKRSTTAADLNLVRQIQEKLGLSDVVINRILAVKELIAAKPASNEVKP